MCSGFAVNCVFWGKQGKWLKPLPQAESVRFILMMPTHSDEDQLTTLYLPRKRPWCCFPAKTAKECLCMLGVFTRDSSTQCGSSHLSKWIRQAFFLPTSKQYTDYPMELLYQTYVLHLKLHTFDIMIIYNVLKTKISLWIWIIAS